jgi:hypothetical protein
MPTAVYPTSPKVAHPVNKVNMSTKVGAGGMALPETYKWVCQSFWREMIKS